MSLYNNILETIGNTPLVKLEKFKKAKNLNNNFYAKLESFNPANNIKTRAAYYMIKSYYEAGKIDSSYTIIEATSGNTGIGLAMVGAYYGNDVIIIMPDKVSEERIKIIKHYGAKVILTPASEGINGSIKKAKELAKTKKAIIPSQFSNLNNSRAHYETTAKELARDLENIDYIFITVGTGGTVSGVGRYFKELGLKTKIIAIEPKQSPVLSGKASGKHKIAGISPGFIPDIYKEQYVDDIELVDDEEAWKLTKEFVRIEGISIGISSGACLQAALNYSERMNLKEKNIVCILADSGEKYLSTGVFD
ncbi:MAG: cysteine synthase family protein [Candidatus Izimaplasma sp.]|nr:cysteine synthase family protein [Candidatus Izimaplasma bacterium]